MSVSGLGHIEFRILGVELWTEGFQVDGFGSSGSRVVQHAIKLSAWDSGLKVDGESSVCSF